MGAALSCKKGTGPLEQLLCTRTRSLAWVLHWAANLDSSKGGFPKVSALLLCQRWCLPTKVIVVHGTEYIEYVPGMAEGQPTFLGRPKVP